MPAQADTAGVYIVTDPARYSEAMESADWKRAMQAEFDSLIENGTWEYVYDVPVREATGCKWVFKTKTNADGSIRHKARLVIKGYEQTAFGETYTPVARLSSFRTLLALSAVFGWEVHHMDVITAFLNPKIDTDDVYMRIPEGLSWLDPSAEANFRKPEGVCRLRKAIYGLKQAPRLWYRDIDAFLRSIGFAPCDVEANLYFSESHRSALLLYVDDMLIASSDVREISKVKAKLSAQYKMTGLGLARQFLGIDIRQGIPVAGGGNNVYHARHSA